MTSSTNMTKPASFCPYIQGAFGQHPNFPSVAGFEGAGIIDAVGEGVSMVPGTRVIVKSTGTWQQYQAGFIDLCIYFLST